MSEDGITPSSGNVFADLGRPDADEALVKADLTREIVRLIQQRGWTQARAARALGIDQPKVSALMRGRLRDFSTERLIRFLNDLDQEVEIAVRPKAATAQRAGVRVSVEGESEREAIDAPDIRAERPRSTRRAMTLNLAAEAIGAQNQALVNAARQSLGLASGVGAINRAMAASAADTVNRLRGPAFAVDAMSSALMASTQQSITQASGLASSIATIKDAIAAGFVFRDGLGSAAEAATNAIKALSTTKAMQELQSGAAALAAAEAGRAMETLQVAATLVKGLELGKLGGTPLPPADILAKLTASLEFYSANPSTSAYLTRSLSMSGAMADMFANGVAAIEFRTSGGLVEIEASGDIVSVPADDDAGVGEAIEVNEGVTIQRDTERRLRLNTGAVTLKLIAA